MRGVLGLALGVIAILLVHVLLANDGRHHWHEFRDLYSGAFYSTTDLMRGVFDPGPAPMRAPDEVAAWYSTKLLHIYLLGELARHLGPGLGTLEVIGAVYALMVIVSAVSIALTLRCLAMPLGRSGIVAAVFLLSPVPIYLSYKLMGEVPSLLCATVAMAVFAASVQTRSVAGLGASAISGAALALSALAGWIGPTLFLSFWLALVLGGVPSLGRLEAVAKGALLLCVCLIVMTTGLALLGGSLAAYVAGLAANMAFTKSLPMWVFALFNVTLAGMGMWLLLPLGWLSPDAGPRRFFMIWLILSTLPAVILAAGFLEPRFFFAAAVPFAGLVGLAIEAGWEQTRLRGWSRRTRLSLASAVAALVVGGSFAAQPFMPYESNVTQLVQIVQSETASNSMAILLPWNYSDFHLLRFVFPDRPIYLVQSAATERGEPVADPVWTSRYAEMYGDRFVQDSEALARVPQQRLLYIGWTILPSLQNLHDVLIGAGVGGLAGLLDAADVRNHLTESWLWNNRQFPMRSVAQYGQYHVYEVTPGSAPV